MRRTRMLACLGGLLLLACALPAGAQVQNAFSGPTGGIRIVDAGSGDKGTFRLALNTEFFIVRDWLVSGDRVHDFGGNLSLSVTATDYLEVFVSAGVSSAWSNSNDPMLVQRVADVLVGLKGYYDVKPWVVLGGDFSLLFPGGVGDAQATFRATSIGLRANVALDFRERSGEGAPVIWRFTGQYWFDNTANLTESIEQQRLDALGNAANGALETRQLLTAFERLAYGVNRTDTVRLATGIQVPLRARKVGLHPMLEWAWEIPVNRQGYVCPIGDGPNEDGCLKTQKAKAFPMMLTAGLRILPPPEGLVFNVAVDIGLTGTTTVVRELAPTPPYSIILGIGYAFDPGRRGALPATPPEPMGRIRGRILQAGTAEPVEGAVVQVVGQDASAQVTDAGGHFVTYALSEGDAVLAVSHPAYLPAECHAAVPSETDCVLVPAKVGGTLRVLTVDGDGEPVPNVEVRVRGPQERELVSDSLGAASVEELDEGVYTAYVDDPTYLIAIRDFEIEDREEITVRLRIVRKPSRPRVVLKKGEIALRRQITFATGSDQILPSSEPLLHEIADALLRNPEVRRVEIQGHTDNRGNATLNMHLSQQRAESVRRWLVDHGVEPERLEAKGYGPTRPVAPNITAYNRARNRRVQFKIVERGAAAP